MLVKIKETGEIEKLEIIDPRDRTTDIFHVLKATCYGEEFEWDEDEEIDIIKKEDYEWWLPVIANHQILLNMEYTLSRNTNIDTESLYENHDIETEALCFINNVENLDLWMNTNTGSLDELENWKADYANRDEDDLNETWEEWSADLVKVKLDENGEWVEL